MGKPNYAITNYTYNELKTADSLIIDIENLNIEDLDNLEDVNCYKISLLYRSATDDLDNIYDKEYYEKLTLIFDRLAKHNKNYAIRIEVYNREILRRSGLLSKIPSNIDLYIECDKYIYDFAEYMQDEEKLEKMLANIRKVENELSPFEKYLAAYNITKTFKEYKYNEKERDKHFYLRYILYNDYISCGGFTILGIELFERVNIPATYIGPDVDISYNDGYTKEEKNLEYESHARCLVKIDDDKYNIHGIYLSDPTWDNDLYDDMYLYALMTFDRLKEARSLETLSDEDLLLDFHNQDEFKTKTAYFMKKHIAESRNKDPYKNIKDEEDPSYVMTAIADYYNAMKALLIDLDVDKYRYFKDKIDGFQNAIFDGVRKGKKPIDIHMDLFNQVLSEYFDYMLPLVNNKIPMDVILKAAANVKQKVDGYSLEEVANWYEETNFNNNFGSDYAFPYKYDPNNKTEAYLEDNYTK